MRASRCSQLLVAIACLSANSHAQADAAKPTIATRASAKMDSLTADQLRTAQEKLDKGDAAGVEQGLALLAQLGGDAAAQSVVARLRRGLPPQLTEVAIDSLVILQRPSAAPVLLELAMHRRPQVRIKAIEALAALKVKAAQSALLYALDDPSAEVRSAAVSALGIVGNARALPALLTVADRGVTGAWQAIGNLAGAADLKRMLEHATAGDVTLMRPALDALMARSNLPLDAKLRTVQELEKLGSASARVCLVEWLAALKSDSSARVRQVLFDSLKHMDAAATKPNANIAEVAPSKPNAKGKPAQSSQGRVASGARPALAEAQSATHEVTP